MRRGGNQIGVERVLRLFDGGLEEKCVERGRPVVEGMEAEYGYSCAKDILVGDDMLGSTSGPARTRESQ